MNYEGIPTFLAAAGAGNPSGSGSVTSISAGSGLVSSPSGSITTAGTLSLDPLVETLIGNNISQIALAEADIELLQENVDELNVLTQQIVPRPVAAYWATVPLTTNSGRFCYNNVLSVGIHHSNSIQTYYTLDGGETHALCTIPNTSRLLVVSVGALGFVALGINSEECFYSSNGVVFTARPLPGFRSFGMLNTGIGNRIVSTTSITLGRVAYSDDLGVTWVILNLAFVPYTFASDATSRIVASGSQGFSVSSDAGLSWVEVPFADTRAICFDTEKLRFVATDRNTTDVYTSFDGLSWVTHPDFGLAGLNVMFYSQTYHQYFIARLNADTGGFGLEFSPDPTRVGFQTRAQHDPRPQANGFYDIGEMTDRDRVYICPNDSHFNYSTPCTCTGFTSDIVARNVIASQVNYLTPVGGKWSSTGPFVTLTNSTAEVSMVSTGVGDLNFPSNTAVPGDSFSLVMSGRIVTESKNDELTIRVRMNGNIVHTTSAIDLDDVKTEGNWSFRLDGLFRTVGATADLFSHAAFGYSKDTSAGGFRSSLSDTGSTLDTTVPQTMDITAQWNNADIANTFTTKMCVIKKIY